jgi:hypothetical protein
MNFKTTLLVLLASAAISTGQESAPTPTPPPAQEPTPPPAGIEAPSFELNSAGPATGPQLPPPGDFINLPAQPTPPAEAGAEIIEEEVSITEEVVAEPDTDFVDPNQLVPDTAIPAAPPDPRTLAAAGGDQERKLKVRYKEVRIQAEKDPEITALREKAETSPTFEGERAAYRAYYRALFKKMRKIDSNLSKKCDLMEKAYLDRLAQVRLEPTIPLEPPPKPELLAN